MTNTSTKRAAAKIFVAWKLDDMGEWVNERRVATLDEARQLLADEGCAQVGEYNGDDVFFGHSWKIGLASVQGQISIQCKNSARRDELCREAAKTLPTPASTSTAEYAASRGKVSPPPTAEELAAADERDHNSMVDETLAQKEASYKNYPA